MTGVISAHMHDYECTGECNTVSETCYKSNFQWILDTFLIIQILRYFISIQIDIQTLYTKIIRQIILFFHIIQWFKVGSNIDVTTMQSELKMSNFCGNGFQPNYNIYSTCCFQSIVIIILMAIHVYCHCFII